MRPNLSNNKNTIPKILVLGSLIVASFLILNNFNANFENQQKINVENISGEINKDNLYQFNKTELYNKNNVYFEENKGQVQSEISFFLKMGDDIFEFSQSKVVFKIENEIFDLEFLNSNKIRPIGSKILPGISNYYTSDCFCFNISHYDKIQYNNLYDGIDLSYIHTDNGLKYEFLVKPYANIDSIVMSYTRIDLIKLQGDSVEIIKNNKKLFENTLKSWYNDNNEFINISYSLDHKNIIKFKSDNLDHSRPIVIDPYYLTTSIIFGGDNSESAINMALDNKGNIIIGGDTNSTNYPTTKGVVDPNYSGGNSFIRTFPEDVTYADIFISKFSPDLSTLIFSTYLGGSETDFLHTIQIDDDDNIIVLGGSSSPDFPTTRSALQNNLAGAMDLVLFYLSSDGSHLRYSTFYGGSNFDDGFQYSLAKSKTCSWENCLLAVAGRTSSSDFPVLHALNSSFPASFVSPMVFVMHFSFGESDLVFSTYFGKISRSTDAWNYAWCVFFDSKNNIIVLGVAETEVLPILDNSYQKTLNGGGDLFMFKLSPDGQNLLATSYLGGDLGDQILFGGIDSEDNILLGGISESLNYPTSVNAYKHDLTGGVGGRDIVISKLSSDGSKLLMSTYLGGNGLLDISWRITLDPYDNIYIAGITTSTDYPVTAGAYKNTLSDYVDGFISKLAPDGSRLIYSSYFGGNNSDAVLTMDFDKDYNLIIGGATLSQDLPILEGGTFQRDKSTIDIFLSKLDFTMLDDDKDGMDDNWELYYGLAIGLDDSKQDFDNDGIPNIYEFTNWLNPSKNDANKDRDNDGMPNLWEFQMGLQANYNDSQLDKDNDHMPNVWEFQMGLDATKNDANLDKDGDLISNYIEYISGTNANDFWSFPLLYPVFPFIMNTLLVGIILVIITGIFSAIISSKLKKIILVRRMGAPDYSTALNMRKGNFKDYGTYLKALEKDIIYYEEYRFYLESLEEEEKEKNK